MDHGPWVSVVEYSDLFFELIWRTLRDRVKRYYDIFLLLDRPWTMSKSILDQFFSVENKLTLKLKCNIPRLNLNM